MPCLRVTFWALCAAMAVALCTSPTAAAQNLLVNPDFEQGRPGHAWMPAGWDTTQAGLATVFFGRDTILTHGGRRAVSVANASGVWAIEHGWMQSLPIEPRDWGKDAVLTIWTRSIGVDGRAFVVLQAMRDSVGRKALDWKVDREVAENRLGIRRTSDPVLDLGWKRVVLMEPETEWIRHELRVHVPPSTNVLTVRAGVLGIGQLFIDDASLTLEPALPAAEPMPGVNLLADPDFEGDLTAWEISRPPYPSLKWERVAEPVQSGATALRFSGGSGLVRGRAGVAQVLCNRALAGKRLRLVAYAKGDSLISNGYASIYCHTASGKTQDVSTTPVSGSTDWVKLVVEIDVPKDAYAVWTWLAYTAPADGRVYFDNASLEVVGPAGGAARSSEGKP